MTFRLTFLTMLIAAATAPLASACETRSNALSEYRALVRRGIPFLLVKGGLRPLGDTRSPADRSPGITPARLTGLSLGPQGFTEPYDEPVTYSVLRSKSWRVYVHQSWDLPADMTGIVFVRLNDPSHPVVIAEGCHRGVFPADEAEIAALIRCHQGGSCKAGD